jgi:hypothetical protein
MKSLGQQSSGPKPGFSTKLTPRTKVQYEAKAAHRKAEDVQAIKSGDIFPNGVRLRKVVRKKPRQPLGFFVLSNCID